MLGVSALRSLLGRAPAATPRVQPSRAVPFANDLPALDRLIDLLAADGRGLIMVMGKGGVGKTSIAASIGLVLRDHTAHLSTTDPAAHLTMTLAGDVPGLYVDRIDLKTESERYIEKIMKDRGRNLDRRNRTWRSVASHQLAYFHVPGLLPSAPAKPATSFHSPGQYRPGPYNAPNFEMVSRASQPSANTTWLSAMTFLNLVKVEVDYRPCSHHASARRLVRLRHDTVIATPVLSRENDRSIREKM
jgi:hypothetical protein